MESTSQLIEYAGYDALNHTSMAETVLIEQCLAGENELCNTFHDEALAYMEEQSHKAIR